MPRRKLSVSKSSLIQVSVTPDEKAAFDAWCSANNTTMSEIVRKEIAPYIAKGYKLMQGDRDKT